MFFSRYKFGFIILKRLFCKTTRKTFVIKNFFRTLFFVFQIFTFSHVGFLSWRVSAWHVIIWLRSVLIYHFFVDLSQDVWNFSCFLNGVGRTSCMCHSVQWWYCAVGQWCCHWQHDRNHESVDLHDCSRR